MAGRLPWLSQPPGPLINVSSSLGPLQALKGRQ